MGGLSITGYVLEPPRVGQSNSPFTTTPNVYIGSQAAFDAAYPTAETEPRSEYHVFVLKDGDIPDDASFCWTKNEIINRFGYSSQDQRFKTLPGLLLAVTGQLALDSNTSRLSVTAPISSVIAEFPFRLSLGSGSGTPITVTLVALDTGFGTPSAGTAEISQETGNINWAVADLSTFEGQDVRFQQQTYPDFTASDGKIGLIDDVLLLNPIPAIVPTTQFPLIRIGFGEYLTPVVAASEGAFSPDPVAGTVEWARDSGRLKFNSTDTTANTGRPVYYDGS